MWAESYYHNFLNCAYCSIIGKQHIEISGHFILRFYLILFISNIVFFHHPF